MQVALLLTVYVLFLSIATGVLQVDTAFDARVQTRDIAENIGLLSLKFSSSSLLPHSNWGGGLWSVQLILLALVLCLPACNVPAASLIAVLAGALVLIVSGIKGGDFGASLGAYGGFSVLVFLLLMLLVNSIEQVLAHDRMWKAFEQYVPPAVARQYSAQQERQLIGNETRELSILFCDIHGFSSLSEQLDSARLSHLLNRYFDAVSEVIVKHNGTIDKFMGDAVMAFWGAPSSTDDHAQNAVAAAIEIQQKIQEMAQDWHLAQLPRIKVGVGIATGYSFVGHLGSRHRMSYTVIGDTVNTAQRLEKATREYKVPIIISQATATQAARYCCRKLDTIQVSGKHQFLTVYEPLLPHSEVTEELRAELESHHHAVKFFQQRRWSEAGKLFLQLRNSSGNPVFYDAYLQRITVAKPESKASSGVTPKASERSA